MKHTLLILAWLALSQLARAEVAVQMIPLAAPLDTPSAQLSGLSWCADELLILPQRPKFSSGDTLTSSVLYSLHKGQILDAIKSASTKPLAASEIEFDDGDFRAGLFGFDGYEAIVCDGERLWLAVETKVENRYFTTTLVRAKRVSEKRIEVHFEPHSTIESGSGIWNFSDEAMLLAPDALITIHEANGTRPEPMATAVSLINGRQKSIPIPRIPFRITDATGLDELNRFWVINYQWQDDDYLIDNEDWIAKEHPPGASHLLEKNVERLIEFELTNDGIRRTDTPPIYLQLSQEKGRNWEGIVRLDDLGFLLVTDEYPKTYFGFVPYP